MASTMSFSLDFLPWAPVSFPPWPGSMTMVLTSRVPAVSFFGGATGVEAAGFVLAGAATAAGAAALGAGAALELEATAELGTAATLELDTTVALELDVSVALELDCVTELETGAALELLGFAFGKSL